MKGLESRSGTNHQANGAKGIIEAFEGLPSWTRIHTQNRTPEFGGGTIFKRGQKRLKVSDVTLPPGVGVGIPDEVKKDMIEGMRHPGDSQRRKLTQPIVTLLSRGLDQDPANRIEPHR